MCDLTTEKCWVVRKGIGIPHAQDAEMIDFVFHFLPMEYFQESFLPSLNKRANVLERNWKAVEMDEFMNFWGLLLFMTVERLPERRTYWSQEDKGLHKAHNFGSYMTRIRFKSILKGIIFSIDACSILDPS